MEKSATVAGVKTMNDAANAPSVLDAYANIITDLRRWKTTIEECLTYAQHSHTFDDVCQMVLMGRLQFYSFPKAFAIMEYKEFPRQKAYHCFLAGGELESVLDCQDYIINIAKSISCNVVTLSGRKGWERAFKQSGWHPYCTTLYKRIDGGDDEK